MIKHIVIFRFKAAVSDDDRQAFRAMLDALPAQIPQIVASQTGFDLVRSPRAFDLGLVSSFNNLTDLGVYAKHEHHLPVVERAKEICEQVASVDYEY